MRAAIINESDNEVVNVIELEPNAKWQAPEGHFMRFNEACELGMIWDGADLIERATLKEKAGL